MLIRYNEREFLVSSENLTRNQKHKNLNLKNIQKFLTQRKRFNKHNKSPCNHFYPADRWNGLTKKAFSVMEEKKKSIMPLSLLCLMWSHTKKRFFFHSGFTEIFAYWCKTVVHLKKRFLFHFRVMFGVV